MTRNTNALYLTRFIAALMVVILHFAPATIRNNYYNVFKNGGEAVNYFFFISGFVMIVSNRKYIQSTNKNNFPKKLFWIKRIARIYPLYILSLVFVLIFHYFVAFVDKSILIRLPFEVLAIQRWLYTGSINFPGWSISCELLFYVVFPFIVPYIIKGGRTYLFAVLLAFVASILCNFLLLNMKDINNPPLLGRLINTLYQHPILKLPIFMFGTACGIIFERNSIKFFDISRNRLFCTFFCLLLIISLLYYLPKNNIFIEAGILSFIYFFFLLGICSFNGNGFVLYNNKWIILLGDISYGVYILQYPVYLFYKHYIGDINTSLQFVSFITTLIMVSTVTFNLFETPVRTLILSYYKPRADSLLLNKV